MSDSPYRVRRTETAQAIFDGLDPERQAQLRGCFEMLAKDPFPGPGSKVVRLRMSPPTPTPSFFVLTEDFGVIFTVDGDLVEILAFGERSRV